jgi:hypothetical protein
MDIRAGTGWNEAARPFTRTKTADQTIDRICRYCSRVSGPAHEPVMLQNDPI